MKSLFFYKSSINMNPFRKDYTRFLEDFTRDELKLIITAGIDILQMPKEDFTPFSAAHSYLFNYTSRTPTTDKEEKLFNEIFREVMLERGYKDEEINYSWTDRWGVISNPYQLCP
jgi:hypothetical protein